MNAVEKFWAETQKQIQDVPLASPVTEAAYDLKDLIGDSEAAAEIVLEDYAAGKTVKDAEAAIHKWVDENHKGNVGGCPRFKAYEIIRGVFGLPEHMEEQKPAESHCKAAENAISLLDFM